MEVPDIRDGGTSAISTGVTMMDEETHATTPERDHSSEELQIVPAEGLMLLAEGLPSAEGILKLLGEADSRSEQIGVLQRAWSGAGRPMLEEDAVAVLGKLNKAGSRNQQLRVLQFSSAKFATVAALDAAGGLRPEAFARLLDQAAEELGRFLSAAQAQEVRLTAAPCICRTHADPPCLAAIAIRERLAGP
jgi:hypothetical protein